MRVLASSVLPIVHTTRYVVTIEVDASPEEIEALRASIDRRRHVDPDVRGLLAPQSIEGILE